MNRWEEVGLEREEREEEKKSGNCGNAEILPIFPLSMLLVKSWYPCFALSLLMNYI